MAAGSSVLSTVDGWLDELFAGWNFLTTIILLLLLVYLIYPLVTLKDPDTHPLILSRQANVSAIRQPGQSAVYRSNGTPHGFPLKSGLNVKDPGAPAFAGGKDGDVRDIWRRAVSGAVDARGESTGEVGKIITVRGGDRTKEQDLASVSKEINAIGSYLKSRGVTAVAIYLPNSVELLTAVFASAFYGFHPVLIPYDKPKHVVLKLLNITSADFLIAAAGSLPSEDVRAGSKGVKEVMWVVEETSRDVDWTDAAEGTSSWHEVVEEQKDATSELPTNSPGDQVKDFITLWLDESPTSGELVAFTHKNIVAAVGSQVAALPSLHRLSPKDLFLPAESLTAPNILIQTFAALFANASIAINSVAGNDVPLQSVARSIAPTVIAATSAQAFQLHDSTKSNVNTAGKKYALSAQQAALKTGVMPTPSLATKLATPVTANLGSKPGSLRLLYIFDRTNSDTPPASSARLSELRAFTAARVVHALTTAKVAGPIAQTHLHDYRRDEDDKSPGHFGVPPSCLELFVKDSGEYKTTDERARGELVARGPAVANEEANLGIYGEFKDDGCLNYLFQYPQKAEKQLGS